VGAGKGVVGERGRVSRSGLGSAFPGRGGNLKKGRWSRQGEKMVVRLVGGPKLGRRVQQNKAYRKHRVKMKLPTDKSSGVQRELGGGGGGEGERRVSKQKCL